MLIFFDTGAFYALAVKGDFYHQSAELCLDILKLNQAITSMAVVVETYRLLKGRHGNHQANRFWKSMLNDPIEILSIDETIFLEAFKIEIQYDRVGFGLVDCTSFALCEKHKIETVFTFDRKHFEIYRPKFTSALKIVPEI